MEERIAHIPFFVPLDPSFFLPKDLFPNQGLPQNHLCLLLKIHKVIRYPMVTDSLLYKVKIGIFMTYLIMNYSKNIFIPKL